MSFFKGFEKIALETKTVKRLYESGLKKRISRNTNLLDRLSGRKKKLMDEASKNATTFADAYGTHKVTKDILKGPLAPGWHSSGHQLKNYMSDTLRSHMRGIQKDWPKK